METNTNIENVNEGKNIAIIAYITLIGLIIAFVMNNEKKNSFAAYHIRQSLGLICTGFALGLVNIIPILGWVIAIFGTIILICLWIFGILNAINEKKQPIPLVGKLYNKWFENIK